MYKFKFFVHCKGWKDGGYTNTHFAETKKEAKERVAKWNEEAKKRVEYFGDTVVDGLVDLLEITKITDEEFAADYIPAYL